MSTTESSGPRYWKSLDDLAETPAFKDWVKDEFPEGADGMEGVNRRQFMKVMAASFGLAGLGMAGCRRPEQTILPYSKQPENVIPGIPVYYSSSVPGLRDNVPVIVETHTGRPTKIEGNPSYKPNGGGTTVHTQASVLDLYDPDRATKSVEGGATLSQASVRDRLEAIRKQHGDDQGAGLVFLAEPSTSPSRAALVAELTKAFPKATWNEYTPVDESTSDQAARAVFGKPVRALPKFEAAKRVLSLDADFLGAGEGHTAKTRAFAKGRKVKDSKDAAKMSRLYSVESTLTSTGAAADHRLRLSAGQISAFAGMLALAVFKAKNVEGALVADLEKLLQPLEIDANWVRECAADLVENAGHALVVAGEHLPKAVHAIVLTLNEALQAPVEYVEAPAPAAGGIDATVTRLNAGDVKTLVVLGGNPVYNAPVDLKFAEAQSKAATSIYLGSSVNETAKAVGFFIAQSHYLESWSDGRTLDGTLVPVQPMIEPLFPTFNELEVLARLAGASSKDPYEIVKASFAALGGKDFSKFLSDGLLAGSAFKTVAATVNGAKAAELITADGLAVPALSATSLEVRYKPSSHAGDGRFANNGWMMECPDPMTKLTWDNPILISPRLAKELEQAQGIRIFQKHKPMNQDSAFFEAAKGTQQVNKAEFNRGKEQGVMAELTINGRTIKAPIHVVPGMANYSIELPLGLGRTVAGRVGNNVGFDFYSVRDSAGLATAQGATIKLTTETYNLANTQEHWSMEGRAIVREGTAAYYKKTPDFATKMGVESHAPANYGKHDSKSLQDKAQHNYRGNSAYEHPTFSKPDPNVKVWNTEEGLKQFPKTQQWGMTIDLNSCFGCSACVVACQSENNIPIVGKDQVLRGREMHWMRLDRYFSTKEYNQGEIPEDVQVSFMGMLCQHCENAPCESVCPVNATVHDKQGLNTMAYNRCVGTRYCANNCAYKVRRFNFLDWNKRKIGEFYKGPFGAVDEPELHKMQKNPNVTVRMRGVMEKCTFCTQRIEAAKIEQKRLAGASADIHVKDGAIKTACQQVCPTDAITFGDIADPNTEVSKAKANDRNYSVLGYLNTRPRTTYLARLRNPNPKMPDAYDKPYAYKEYKERYGSGGHSDHGAHDDHGHSHDAHGADAHH
ncbi:TAT-variant-translocated molybdopterin oxidoreductase [Coraliomargarita akajimensis]|uniref:Fe-S-cluster-containing hydrogenase components 1-like protein n=1 Tax=Coraliomargarita akajimensis (strain DSM 45221 / IAM 15411 / JCM 23193 / KCTC 12865 / 04OKA010-24) TaxID=583355 RepID=D5EKG6_CORAD|nr:TAT-variant-translocated molybdopterin oxidoreductase [Coraliomargarita akajimensis]ADE53047.1 Fe-S-cluster-containing hydrogenase components 1- like protein [Coraliomargarita akajimensis DSM 45221]